MGQTFLHIGYYKTASTLLQNHFFSYLKGLRFVATPELLLNHEFNRLLYEDEAYYSPEKLAEEFAQMQGNHQNLLISSEWLVGDTTTLAGHNRSRIARRLYQLAPSAEIILFLRGQADLMASIYNQKIKIGATDLRPQDFFRSFPDPKVSLGLEEVEAIHRGRSALPERKALYYYPFTLNIHPHFFDYFTLVKLYKQLFEKVHVVPFERFKTDPEGVLHQLIQIVGAEADPQLIQKVAQMRSNESLGPAKLAAKRIANKFKMLTQNPTVLAGISRLAQATQAPLDPKTFAQTWAKKHYAESNQKLAKAYPEIGLQDYPQAYFLA